MYDQATFKPETGFAETPAGTPGGAGPHAATDSGSFEHRERMHGGATRDSGLRYFYVPRREGLPGFLVSETSKGLLWILLVCGVVGMRLLPWMSRMQPIASLGLGGYRVLAPIAMSFAVGVLFGGRRGNIVARCMLINAAGWCWLILYFRTAEILEWPDIMRMLPLMLVTQTPIILGAYLRRGTIN
jgi:hypothetical protein